MPKFVKAKFLKNQNNAKSNSAHLPQSQISPSVMWAIFNCCEKYQRNHNLRLCEDESNWPRAALSSEGASEALREDHSCKIWSPWADVFDVFWNVKMERRKFSFDENRLKSPWKPPLDDLELVLTTNHSMTLPNQGQKLPTSLWLRKDENTSLGWNGSLNRPPGLSRHCSSWSISATLLKVLRQTTYCKFSPSKIIPRGCFKDSFRFRSYFASK